MEDMSTYIEKKVKICALEYMSWIYVNIYVNIYSRHEQLVEQF